MRAYADTATLLCRMRRMFLALVALLFMPVLPAQLYRDLTFTRNRPSPYSTVLEARAGLLGGFPETTDAAVGNRTTARTAMCITAKRDLGALTACCRRTRAEMARI